MVTAFSSIYAKLGALQRYKLMRVNRNNNISFYFYFYCLLFEPISFLFLLRFLLSTCSPLLSRILSADYTQEPTPTRSNSETSLVSMMLNLPWICTYKLNGTLSIWCNLYFISEQLSCSFGSTSFCSDFCASGDDTEYLIPPSSSNGGGGVHNGSPGGGGGGIPSASCFLGIASGLGRTCSISEQSTPAKVIVGQTGTTTTQQQQQQLHVQQQHRRGGDNNRLTRRYVWSL